MGERSKRGFVDNSIYMLHRNLRERIRAFQQYGGLKCACCGQEEFSFLSLDHIDDGAGNTERMEVFGKKYQGGRHFYRNLRLRGYPAGFQVLCMNCQVGRRDNGGVCPHKSKRMTGDEILAEFEKLRVGWGNRGATRSEMYQVALANVSRRGAAKPISPA
jgi:hypothetical protein